MSEHRHSFADSEWPFSDPINTAAFTTVRVVRDGYPVLLVTHDEEGDWQILNDPWVREKREPEADDD